MGTMVIQTSFNAGEFSPLLGGHIDAPQRNNAVKTCKNLIALPQGPVTRRNGTRFIAPAKYPELKTALLRFEFNVDQAYVLEVGDRYIRFYHHQGVILAEGTQTPYEITTPYTQDVLWDGQGVLRLRTVQSGDLCYVAHPDYPPKVLMRLAHNHWELTDVIAIDGPYLDENTTTTTISASALTGTVSLTASGDLFASTDEGRLLRLADPHHWGYVTITRYKDARHVEAIVKAPLSSTAATLRWRMGSWSQTTGYPACMALYQDRLCFAGVHSAPQRIETSCSGDFTNFAPSDADGTIAEDHGLSMVLSADAVNAICALMPHEQGLVVATIGGMWRISSGNSARALSPLAMQAVCFSTLGSSRISAALGNSLVCVQRARKKMYLLNYLLDEERFRTPDITLYAPHLMQPGITALAWQEEPYGVLWALRADGVLLGMTYQPDQEVAAWHQHVLGGNGIVEAITVMPGYGETSQELWMVVQRTQNQTTSRHIEILPLATDQHNPLSGVSCLDSALCYQGGNTHILRGLEHLEGYDVSVVAEGADAGSHRVQDGMVILNLPCTQAVVGLAYRWSLETLPLLEGNRFAALPPGQVARIDHLMLRLVDSLGICYGQGDELILNASGYGEAPALFSGDTETLPLSAGYSSQSHLALSHDGPYPVTILAILAQV